MGRGRRRLSALIVFYYALLNSYIHSLGTDLNMGAVIGGEIRMTERSKAAAYIHTYIQEYYSDLGLWFFFFFCMGGFKAPIIPYRAFQPPKFESGL